MFVIYCGSSERDFASSVMTLVSHGVELNSSQPTLGQVCTLFWGENAKEKKKSAYRLIFTGLDQDAAESQVHQSSVKCLMSLNPHSFCED